MSPKNLSVCTRGIVRREKNPDTFDGRSNDWKVYLVHFEQTAAWNKWTEQEKAQQLSMSLRGTAQQMLGDLRPDEISDYKTLKDILGQRFDPKERVTAYQTEFHSRRRTWGETIPDFGYAFRRLVCMAYPKDRFDDTLERLAINQFIAGLGDWKLAWHLKWYHKSTLESAIACAVEFEAFSDCQNINVQKPKMMMT